MGTPFKARLAGSTGCFKTYTCVKDFMMKNNKVLNDNKHRKGMATHVSVAIRWAVNHGRGKTMLAGLYDIKRQ